MTVLYSRFSGKESIEIIEYREEIVVQKSKQNSKQNATNRHCESGTIGINLWAAGWFFSYDTVNDSLGGLDLKWSR